LKGDLGRIKDRGSNNSRIFHSTREPFNQVNKDIWINPDALNTLYVKKSSDTSRASTTSLTDDPHLSITLPGSGIFSIDSYLMVTGSSGGDINVSWDLSGVSALVARNYSSGMSLSSTNGANCSMNTFSTGLTSQNAYGVYSSTYANCINMHMIVESSSSGGVVTLEWAQKTSNATPTILESDSHIEIRQLDGDVSLLKWYSSDDVDWKFIV
jgi:hypothetical protein